MQRRRGQHRQHDITRRHGQTQSEHEAGERDEHERQHQVAPRKRDHQRREFEPQTRQTDDAHDDPGNRTSDAHGNRISGPDLERLEKLDDARPYALRQGGAAGFVLLPGFEQQNTYERAQYRHPDNAQHSDKPDAVGRDVEHQKVHQQAERQEKVPTLPEYLAHARQLAAFHTFHPTFGGDDIDEQVDGGEVQQGGQHAEFDDLEIRHPGIFRD